MGVDLKLLKHLSDEALHEEAQRRGVRTADKSRDAIIDAIRSSVRSSARPSTEASAEPRAVSKEKKRGMFGVAKKLFGRVVRSVLERESSAPAPLEPPAPKEPIPTRTMAELLIDQGKLERAIGILATLDDEDARERRAEIEAQLVRSKLTKAAAAHRREGVVILTERGARAVAWQVENPGVARARALLRADGELTLRIVTVEADATHAVTNRSEDRGPVAARGFELLDASPSARLVISIGLRADERFVSIAHTAS